MSPFLPISSLGGATVGAGVDATVTFLADKRTSSKNWKAFKMPNVLLKIAWKIKEAILVIKYLIHFKDLV